MTADELKIKIAKMETALKSDSTPKSVKPGIEKALNTARAALAEMEATKKVLKKDFYAAMDKINEGLTQAQVSALKQVDYEAKMSELEKAAAQMGVPEDKVENYAYAYIFTHLPKGESVNPKTKPTPVETKKIDPPMEAPTTKTTAPKVEKKASAFSWKKKVAIEKLKPIVLHCQHYVKTIGSPTLVSLKGSGNSSVQVTAQKGEYLILDDQGYPVFIMNPSSFNKKCNEGTTVDQHKELQHQTEANKALKTKIVQFEKQIKEVTAKEETAQQTIKKLETDIAKAKQAPHPAKSSSTPTPPQRKAKTDDPPKTPASPVPKPNPAPAKPKRATCTLEEAKTGARLSRVIKFFIDQAELWHKSKTSRKITKIMRTKGDKQEIILQVADYAGMSGLTTLLGNRKYYRLCVDSFKMDKVAAPARGSYSVVVKENQMKQVYTTRGTKQYTICLKSYRELLKCSLEGSCTADQSAKWKTLYKECGDLVQKLEKHPKAMRQFHKEVKSRRKAGELYSDAMSRVAREIKKSSA